MLIDKAELLKTLRVIQTFDTNVSPFIGVQLVDDKMPRFYRSSLFGFIQSVDFGTNAPTNVSLLHLLDCLKALREDKISMDLDPNGTLRLSSTDNTFESELRVHTVTAAAAGLKKHDVQHGQESQSIEASAFLGIDTAPFKVKTPPVLINGRLMLATSDAVIMWTGPDTLKACRVHPRASFLRMAAGNSAVERLMLTPNGYWGVIAGGLLLFIYGHSIGKELFDNYNVPSVVSTRLPAERLVDALRAAASLQGDRDRIEIDPKAGVVARNRFGGDGKFGLGGAGGFDKFGIFGGTATAIVDALSQSKDEDVELSVINSMAHPTLRLRRGPFEVNFKTI